MKRIVEEEINKEKLKDFIEEFYNDLNETYEDLCERRDYLVADLKNREEFHQSTLEQSIELKDINAQTTILSDVLKNWNNRLDNNDIEFEEDD